MTDKERILLHIIQQLYGTMVLRGSRDMVFVPQIDTTGREYVGFAGYRGPKPGDLVLCQTSSMNDWLVAWYVEARPDVYGGAVLREIGTGRLCNYGNESFVPIVGLVPEQLLEGAQRQFLEKVWKAFRRGDEYVYRYGGIEFLPEKTARIAIREVFGGLNQDSVPFHVEMKWSRRTSIAEILRQLRAGGYGTRQFERRPVADQPVKP